MNEVLVIEKSDVVRCSIVSALRQHGHEAAGMATGKDLTAALATSSPELIIIDVGRQCELDRLALLRSITRAGIIMLCDESDRASEAVVACLQHGADDCVTKPFRTAELLARADAVLRRLGARGRSLTFGDLVIADEGAHVCRGDVPIELTATERRLLAALARTPNRVVLKSQLSTAIWGNQANDNTIEAHISSLRRRLQGDGRRLIHTVRGQGYRLGPMVDDRM